MKKIKVLILIAVSFLWTSETFGQQPVPYGSNNGKYVSIFDTQIYYEEYGKGTPLILLHGGLGSIRDFAKCIPELSQHFRVIAPDSPSLGRSELADSLSYQLMAEYISKMIDILQLDSAFVIGWSDGAITGLLLAKNRPDKVKKVLSSGPNYKLSGVTVEFMDVWRNKLSNIEWMETQNKEWVENYINISPHDNWKKYVTDTKKMWFQETYFPESDLLSIRIPVMIVLGDDDVVTLEHGIEMHRLINNSQFCVLPNTSHSVFSERPDVINQIAINFFKE